MISSTSLAYFSGLPTCRSLQRNAKVPNVSLLRVLSEGRRLLVVAEIASTRRCELPPNFAVWVLSSVHIDVHVTAQ
jgi:hypothetical protein